jgi:hypothetical protein
MAQDGLCKPIAHCFRLTEIQREYLRKKYVLETCLQHLGAVKALAHKLRCAAKQRARALLALRSVQVHFASKVSWCGAYVQVIGSKRLQHGSQLFQMHLRKQGYIGALEMDHAQGLLQIKVRPNSHAGISQDLRSLSGGERSFATVAFITVKKP